MKPSNELSPQQLQVIDALSSGATMIGAAEAAGVHRNTISNWRRTNTSFREALAGAQYDRAETAREMVTACFPLALQTIREILADPNAPASVRLKAALAIVEKASTAPPPEAELPITITAQVHNNAQSAQPAPATASEAVQENLHNLHNDAQSTVADDPDALDLDDSEPAPTDPCPCGAGLVGMTYGECCKPMFDRNRKLHELIVEKRKKAA